MKKKPPFLQKVKTIGYFVQPKDDVELHGKALDGREGEALIFPNRIKDKTVKTNYVKTFGGYFSKLYGREIDQFDPELQSYYNKPDRPLGQTTKEVIETAPDGTQFKIKKALVWNTIGAIPKEEISPVPPLLDGTHTPRSGTKAISLPRVYEGKVWKPANTHLHEFDKLNKKKKTAYMGKVN